MILSTLPIFTQRHLSLVWQQDKVLPGQAIRLPEQMQLPFKNCHKKPHNINQNSPPCLHLHPHQPQVGRVSTCIHGEGLSNQAEQETLPGVFSNHLCEVNRGFPSNRGSSAGPTSKQASSLQGSIHKLAISGSEEG